MIMYQLLLLLSVISKREREGWREGERERKRERGMLKCSIPALISGLISISLNLLTVCQYLFSSVLKKTKMVLSFSDLDCGINEKKRSLLQ